MPASPAVSPPWRFWRHPDLPFLEARDVTDGRRVCYAPHAHETFSIGAITAGRNLYHHEKRREAIGAGDVVLMNPGEVHACQPLEAGQTWAYHMLYVDAGWLAALWQDNDRQTGRRWQPLPAILCRHPALHAGLVRLGATLFDPLSAPLAQHSAAIGFFEGLQRFFRPETGRSHLRAPDRLDRAAELLHADYARAVSLPELCAATDLTESYLIRAFRQRYGMTPHQYLLNRRVQVGRRFLRQGEPIADVALATGFADQAHFQRVFKRLVAATPGQYRQLTPACPPHSRPAAAPVRD